MGISHIKVTSMLDRSNPGQAGTVRQAQGRSGAGRLHDGVSAEEARATLNSIRAGLVDKNGRVLPGYVSLVRNRDGKFSLSRKTSFLGAGSRAEGRQLMVDYMTRAYASKLSPASRLALEHSLDHYLARKGEKLGTRSLVSMLDRLEDGLYQLQKNDRLKAGRTASKQPGSMQVKFDVSPNLGENTHSTLRKLEEKLDSSTRQFFQRMLSPPLIERSRANGAAVLPRPTHVAGDADGSVCRLVLAALGSGHADIDEEGLNLLAQLMQRESTASADLKKFQEDESLAEKYAQLVLHIEGKKNTERQLVFLGDILHDRFSNNKVAMATLIRKLYGEGEHGVVFITGNHDVWDEAITWKPAGPLEGVTVDLAILGGNFELVRKILDQNPQKQWSLDDLTQELSQRLSRLAESSDEEEVKERAILEKVWDLVEAAEGRGTPDDFALLEKARKEFRGLLKQSGEYSARPISKDSSEQLRRDCFVNAYFDPVSSALYTHTGVIYDAASNTFTSGGMKVIGAPTPEKLAEGLNAIDAATLQRGDFTGFRPLTEEKDGAKAMQTDNLGPIGKWRNPEGVEQKLYVVHGHDGTFGVTDNAVHLNARVPKEMQHENEAFGPIVAVIE